MNDRLLFGEERSTLGALEGQDSLLSAASTGRHLPAPPEDACSHQHRGR